MNKRPEKMTEQDKLLDIQFGLAKESRVVDIITVVAMMAIIYVFALLIYIIPDMEYSEQENRYLQTFPEFTLERLVDGSFTGEIADYFSDQFPARDIFVGIKGVTEIALLKQENNNVVAAKDGYIVKRDDYPEYEAMDGNLSAITDFSAAMEKAGVPYYIAMAGRHEDVLDDYMPLFFPTDRADKIWTYMETAFSADSYLQYINLRQPLSDLIAGKAGAIGDQYYYRTDHHWTTTGAYYGYANIMNAMGVEPQPLTAFTPELVSDAFYGTTWSSAGMKWIKPDEMYYFRYEGDDTDYTTTIADTGESFTGFYDRSYLEKKDKYSSFIGGNNARVDIVKTQNREEGRETMLLIKDSFAHSLSPFLAHDYDLIIIDLRYFKEKPIDIVTNEGVDRVLIMNYMGSLVDVNVFGMLKYGLSDYLSK